MGWQEWFDQARADKVTSGGNELYLYRAGGVRFKNSEHCITLIGEFEDASSALGKKWLVLPTLRHIIYLPTIVCWDDGESIEHSAFQLILQQVSEAISNSHQIVLFMKSDEVYEKAKMDWLVYGQHLPSRLGDRE